MSKLKTPLDFAKGAVNAGLQRKASREAKAGNAQGEMTLVEHVIELRNHLVRSAVYFGVFSLVTFIFMDEILAFLRMPFESYQRSIGKEAKLMSTAVFEVVMMNFKVCLIVALVLSVPFFFWEVWKFVAPALYEKEKQIARPLTVASIIMFYLGIAFGFFVIVPVFLSNTLDWASKYAQVMLTVDNYYNSLATMVFLFGIIFEVPILMSLLGLAGIITSDMVAKNRRIVFFSSFLIGALLSPPDVFSQTIVSVPLYAMVEVSVFALRRIERRKAAEQKILEAQVQQNSSDAL